MIPNDKITVTYESIFEILMREKTREELQKLNPDLFDNLVNYVSEKKKNADNQTTESLDEKERTSKQLRNISRMLTDLYERREKKITNMALISSRAGSDIVDTSPLLEDEKALFDAIIEKLDYYRNNILLRVLDAKPKPTEKKVEEPTIEKNQNTKVVRFLHEVPKFVGKELETYGPFGTEDMANLPSEIADILIKKGRAEEMS